MIKLLYANGCSMTEGAEIGNRKFNYDETTHRGPSSHRSGIPKDHAEYMEAHAYPAVVANLLNIPNQINDGLGGSSNRRIVRTTIARLEEQCLTYDPSELFVVIGFSNINRFEHFGLSRFEQIIYHPPKNKFGFGHMIETDDQKYFRLKVDVGQASLEEMLVQHFMEVLLLKQYLESKKIKFVFSYGLIEPFPTMFTQEQIDRACSNKEIQTLFNLVEYTKPDVWVVDVIRSNTLPDFIRNITSYSFFDYVVRRRFLSGTGGHPLEQAHDAWATHIAQFVTKNNIL